MTDTAEAEVSTENEQKEKVKKEQNRHWINKHLDSLPSTEHSILA